MAQTRRLDRYFYTFAPHEPAMKVSPGSVLRIECPDSDNAFADGSTIPEIAQFPKSSSSPFLGNPMAGPIYVEGAAPGDVLAVKVLDVALTSSTGQTLLKPGHGYLSTSEVSPDDPSKIPTHMYCWKIDASRQVAQLTNPLGTKPIEVALSPFIGCIGVCPKWGQATSTLFAGSFGGNMDIPLLAKDATLFLPVYADGALLGLGDLHAAQGHGELIGGAIETAGEVEIEIDLLKEQAIASPRIRTSTSIAAIASESDVSKSIRMATSYLIDWLAQDYQLNRFDAYQLISQTAQLVMGNLGSGTPSVACSIELDRLPKP